MVEGGYRRGWGPLEELAWKLSVWEHQQAASNSPGFQEVCVWVDKAALLGPSSSPAASSLHRQPGPLPLSYWTGCLTAIPCPQKLTSECSSLSGVGMAPSFLLVEITQPLSLTPRIRRIHLHGVEMVAVLLLRTKLEEMGFAWSLPDLG